MDYALCRDESDVDEIERLFITTFTPSEGPEEGRLIGGLARAIMTGTEAGDRQGFVARDAGRLVGAILFTRLTFARPVSAWLLAPVAVHPEVQRRGVGQGLIRFGLAALAAAGEEWAVTYGDPAFYTKVGFRVVTEAMIPAPRRLQHPEGWMARSLTGRELEPLPGPSRCVTALDQPAYW